jgi:hypothetical protein
MSSAIGVPQAVAECRVVCRVVLMSCMPLSPSPHWTILYRVFLLCLYWAHDGKGSMSSPLGVTEPVAEDGDDVVLDGHLLGRLGEAQQRQRLARLLPDYGKGKAKGGMLSVLLM